MTALRREHFAAEGVDPDRAVWVYQYFAHRAFAAALRDGRAPSPGFDDALLAHALVEAAYRSCASGLPEPLAPLLA
jgi:predicted dehydrogenase